MTTQLSSNLGIITSQILSRFLTHLMTTLPLLLIRFLISENTMVISPIETFYPIDFLKISCLRIVTKMRLSRLFHPWTPINLPVLIVFLLAYFIFLKITFAYLFAIFLISHSPQDVIQTFWKYLKLFLYTKRITPISMQL